jgi:hypothetical protein
MSDGLKDDVSSNNGILRYYSMQIPFIVAATLCTKNCKFVPTMASLAVSYILGQFVANRTNMFIENSKTQNLAEQTLGKSHQILAT